MHQYSYSPGIFLACLCLGLGSALPSANAAARTWTQASSGRTLDAEYVSFKEGNVYLQTASGIIKVPFVSLHADDQAYVRGLAAGAGAGMVSTPPATPDSAPASSPAAPPSRPRIPIGQRAWPQNVEVPTRSIEIAVVTEEPKERRYVYRSESFEFTSQAKLAGSVMKEVARTFEATKSLVEALPWGIVCRPSEGMPRYLAALYESRADYIAAGGPENSGGVYSRADKTFKIPFPSLGMEKRGQTYFKNDNYSNGTLVHEITHQMMDEYLPFLPKWVIEGTAEYTEMLPYKAGVFRADAHKNGMKEDAEAWEKREGFVMAIPSLEQHFTMNRKQWDDLCLTNNQAMRDLYHRSQILVYYFCHLDGDKTGLRFLKFFESVHADVEAMRAFFADPRVKRMPGGRFSYPSSMTPPNMDADTAFVKHLPILLEERDFAKLAAQVVEGFRSIGVKVSVGK